MPEEEKTNEEMGDETVVPAVPMEEGDVAAEAAPEGTEPADSDEEDQEGEEEPEADAAA